MPVHPHFAGVSDTFGRIMHHHQLYPLLGLGSGEHLPPEGFDKTVNGVRFFCEPKSNKGRNSPHRIRIECPICQKWYPFGRMNQHMKRKDHQ